jgi:heterodisulfide reductase subunit C
MRMLDISPISPPTLNSRSSGKVPASSAARYFVESDQGIMSDAQRHNSDYICVDEVVLVPGGESPSVCYACGTCVSRCIIPWRDPVYNPRWVLHKAALGMRQAVFDDAIIWYCTACDLCYSSCPQEVRISDIIGALRQLALEAGYTFSLEVQGDVRVSTVGHNRCMGCGGCVAVCPNNAIGSSSFADQPIREQLNQALREWA